MHDRAAAADHSAEGIGVVDVRQQKLIFTYGHGAFELAR
jgi:hypothetical protein